MTESHPSCCLGRARRVPGSRLQLQCCTPVAGLLCCSLSLSSWLQPGTANNTETKAAAHCSPQQPSPGNPCVCPFPVAGPTAVHARLVTGSRCVTLPLSLSPAYISWGIQRKCQRVRKQPKKKRIKTFTLWSAMAPVSFLPWTPYV